MKELDGMYFEPGKYYKHNSGRVIHCLTYLDYLNTAEPYGPSALLAETTGKDEFIAVGTTSDHSINYHEISEEEGIREFKESDSSNEKSYVIQEDRSYKPKTKKGEVVYNLGDLIQVLYEENMRAGIVNKRFRYTFASNLFYSVYLKELDKEIIVTSEVMALDTDIDAVNRIVNLSRASDPTFYEV